MVKFRCCRLFHMAWELCRYLMYLHTQTRMQNVNKYKTALCRQKSKIVTFILRFVFLYSTKNIVFFLEIDR